MRGKFFSSLILSAFAVVLAGKEAHATTFDFVDYADNNEHAALTETITQDGISLTVSAHNMKNTKDLWAYFDDTSNGLPGGLGVCSQSSGDFCSTTDDDNIQNNEILVLSFNLPVEITEITFNNGAHKDQYEGDFGVAIDFTPNSKTQFKHYTAVPVFSKLLNGTMFSFISNCTFGGLGDLSELYISSISVRAKEVPEPMTMSLLGLGLAPALLRRRRQN